MKQRQYNAFEIEFKGHTLDKEEFLNMDETDKTNYLDFLTEKEIRLRERAENEKKRPKLVEKLNKDADKIHDFLQMINKEREQEKEERQGNDEISRNKKQQEARSSYSFRIFRIVSTSAICAIGQSAPGSGISTFFSGLRILALSPMNSPPTSQVPRTSIQRRLITTS